MLILSHQPNGMVEYSSKMEYNGNAAPETTTGWTSWSICACCVVGSCFRAVGETTTLVCDLKRLPVFDALGSGRCHGARIPQDGFPLEGVELPSPGQPRGLQDLLVECMTRAIIYPVEQLDFGSACTPQGLPCICVIWVIIPKIELKTRCI